MKDYLKFPKGFLWGTSTSSYQVEGGIKSDWSEWEKSSARIEQLKKENKNPEEFINKTACNQYLLYKTDFDLAKQLHNNSHRFSVEWARIEPEEGRFDEKEINHYKKVIKALKSRRLEPFLTAYHFTLPLWISDEGGWLNKKSVKYFEDYVSRISSEFNDVRFWITINEPMILLYRGYIEGSWPPAYRNPVKAYKALRNLIQAHKNAYKIIHEDTKAKVGIASNIIYFRGLYKMIDYLFNWHFLNKINNHQDFIGLNYYMSNSFPSSSRFKRSEMGWEICPEGLYPILKHLRGYNLPIYITENGIADSNDVQRDEYILKHLFQIHRAISEGVDVKGYFHWSLIDNFEWECGFAKKFGLCEVDFKTMKRKPRNSFYTYKKICAKNGISRDLLERFG